jgi:putative Ca2+/H+ antiporter (TMEM165/GDT1 family)
MLGVLPWPRRRVFAPARSDLRLLTVATTFFLAELGDKTMLATVTLGSQLVAFVGVWLGSTFGMVVADAVAIVVGQVLGKRLPERTTKIVVALIFFGFGLWALAEASGLVGTRGWS